MSSYVYLRLSMHGSCLSRRNSWDWSQLRPPPELFPNGRAPSLYTQESMWVPRDRAEQVREILTTRGLTLHHVSRRSAELFGRTSQFFIPHNLYSDLARTASTPTIFQVLTLSHITNHRLTDWLRVFGFDLDAILGLGLVIPRRRTTILDSAVYDIGAWIPWFAERIENGPVSPITPLGQVLTLAAPDEQASCSA